MHKFAVSEYYEHEFDKDPQAILIKMHSEEQETSSSCGPAVLTNVFKTLGKEVTQKDIINEARRCIREVRPEDSSISLAGLGTPPEVMEKILEAHHVDFKIKNSVTELNERTDKEAEEYLDTALKSGYAVICAVQTIPNYKKERNISDDGHYLIVCGEITIDGEKNYITVDPMFHYYQRLSNEGSVYGMHMGANVTRSTPKKAKEIVYDTVETRETEYSTRMLKKFGIDPSKYGYRLINADNFIRNWKDVSGFGDSYNHYGIAVKMSTEFDKLPQEIRQLAREEINASNTVESLWKSSPEEPYALRRFNPRRSEDSQRFKDIDRHKKSLQWMDPKTPSSNDDLDYMLRIDETNETDPRIMWAVVDEKDESLGWVQFYKDEHMDTARMLELGIPKDALVLEVSYSKLFKDWPKFSHFVNDRSNLIDTEGRGVAVNGLKQALIRLTQMEDTVAENSTNSARPIFVTAYTDFGNLASEAVLTKNGFRNVGVADYDGEENNVWIKEIE